MDRRLAAAEEFVRLIDITGELETEEEFGFFPAVPQRISLERIVKFF
jgi:hypothetical protein